MLMCVLMMCDRMSNYYTEDEAVHTPKNTKNQINLLCSDGNHFKRFEPVSPFNSSQNHYHRSDGFVTKEFPHSSVSVEQTNKGASTFHTDK